MTHSDVVLEARCLAEDMHEIPDETGCVRWKYTNDAQGGVIESVCLAGGEPGQPDTPARDSEGVHRRRITRDSLHEQNEIRYFDEADRPAGRLKDGCHGLRTTYDDAGNPHTITCLDASGHPTAARGTTVATTRFEHDSAGCLIGTTFADATGAPTVRGDLERELLVVDARCQVLQREYLRPGGQPRALQRGQRRTIAVWRYAYDDEDNRIEQRCYDETLHATSCSGFPSLDAAIVRSSYDARGREVFQRFFHADGRPSRSLTGYPHAIEFRYRDDGRLAEERFYDMQGNPDAALGGVARQTRFYTPFGQVSDVVHHDRNDRPAAPITGCHRQRYTYSGQRRLQQIECLDPRGTLTRTNDQILHGVPWPTGAARVVIERGATPTNRFFDAAGQLMQTLDCLPPEAACYR